VICAPDKSIDIGVNLFKNKPRLNKKFHIKTLCGTCKYVIPDYFQETLDTMENYFICLLKPFYSHGQENNKIVDDYILKLKE
jgi:hypothetical protein